ncbi:hypothetical protein ACETU7_23950 [Rhodococcus sp. 3Y1]
MKPESDTFVIAESDLEIINALQLNPARRGRSCRQCSTWIRRRSPAGGVASSRTVIRGSTRSQSVEPTYSAIS